MRSEGRSNLMVVTEQSDEKSGEMDKKNVKGVRIRARSIEYTKKSLILAQDER